MASPRLWVNVAVSFQSPVGRRQREALSLGGQGANSEPLRRSRVWSKKEKRNFKRGTKQV